MADCYYAVRGDEASLHDVHVLPADGVVQPEALSVVGGHLQGVLPSSHVLRKVCCMLEEVTACDRSHVCTPPNN